MNITQSIERNSAAWPDRVALMVDGQPIVYRALWQRVLVASQRLAAAGVRRGDHVAISLENPLRFISAVLALARMGAVPFNLQRKRGQQQAGQASAPWHGARFLLANGCPPAAGAGTCLDWNVMTAPLGGEAFAPPPMDLMADDLPWWIGSTSGTTGTPKRVARTHAREALLSAAYPGVEHDYYRRVLVLASVGSSFGLSAVLRVLLEGGTTALLRDSIISVNQVFARLLEDRPTSIITSTGNAAALIRYLRKEAVPADSTRSIVERFVMGGSLAPPGLIAGIRAYLCDQIEIRYASSESGLIAVVDEAVWNDRPQAHGRLCPWSEGQALDADGKVLPPGQVGILRFKTPFTVAGYEGDDEATARAFSEGWHIPGDRGTVDAAGYLYLAGRVDDVINVGGNKIDPQSIETVLNAHPAVLESAVLALPSADGDLSMLAAAVVVQGEVDADELRQFCRERLDVGRVPQQIAFVDALPKNDGGKIMRKQLASMIVKNVEGPGAVG